jgi:hypothetical protein
VRHQLPRRTASGRTLRKYYPQSLNGAPLLIPSETNLVRAKWLDWLDSLRIYPHIVDEFGDTEEVRTVLCNLGGMTHLPPCCLSCHRDCARVVALGAMTPVCYSAYTAGLTWPPFEPCAACNRPSAGFLLAVRRECHGWMQVSEDYGLASRIEMYFIAMLIGLAGLASLQSL